MELVTRAVGSAYVEQRNIVTASADSTELAEFWSWLQVHPDEALWCQDSPFCSTRFILSRLAMTYSFQVLGEVDKCIVTCFKAE